MNYKISFVYKLLVLSSYDYDHFGLAEVKWGAKYFNLNANKKIIKNK